MIEKEFIEEVKRLMERNCICIKCIMQSEHSVTLQLGGSDEARDEAYKDLKTLWDACKDEPVEIVGRDWKPDRDEMDFKAGLDRYLTRSDWD